MSNDISAALRREIRERAQGCCEYCLMPDDEPAFPHEPDHIIALKHGGPTVSDNLAYVCFECNRAKVSDIASLDPSSGVLTPLYHPRQQTWNEHFAFDGVSIKGLTPISRATAFLLRLNEPARIAIRENLMREGRYPRPGQ